jgi:hypothetical protein
VFIGVIPEGKVDETLCPSTAHGVLRAILHAHDVDRAKAATLFASNDVADLQLDFLHPPPCALEPHADEDRPALNITSNLFSKNGSYFVVFPVEQLHKLLRVAKYDPQVHS